VTDSLRNLIEEVAAYRGGKTAAVETAKAKSPYGQKIYDLNMAWAAKKKAIAEALAADEKAYKEELEKFTRLHNAWASDNRVNTNSDRRGRPQNQWPDAVKKAAAKAIRDHHSRTMVRTAIGISNTPRFNLLLAEGEELLQAEEIKERDKKQDALEEGGW
jgi:hypothetical protein